MEYNGSSSDGFVFVLEDFDLDVAGVDGVGVDDVWPIPVRINTHSGTF